MDYGTCNVVTIYNSVVADNPILIGIRLRLNVRKYDSDHLHMRMRNGILGTWK